VLIKTRGLLTEAPPLVLEAKRLIFSQPGAFPEAGKGLIKPRGLLTEAPPLVLEAKRLLFEPRRPLFERQRLLIKPPSLFPEAESPLFGPPRLLIKRLACCGKRKACPVPILGTAECSLRKRLSAPSRVITAAAASESEWPSPASREISATSTSVPGSAEAESFHQ